MRRPTLISAPALGALVLVALVSACIGGTPTAPPLADPQEILVRALSTTDALRSVHARIDVLAPGQSVSAAVLEADVDLVTREVSAVLTAPDMAVRQQVRVVDDSVYIRDGDQLWRRERIPIEAVTGIIPPTNEIVAALTEAVTDPTVERELVATEACGDLSCYHVRVLVPAAVVWRTAGELLPGARGAPPADMPGLAFDTWIDRGHLRLIQLKVSLDGTGTGVLTLSEHDRPVFIDPPPASEVAP